MTSLCTRNQRLFQFNFFKLSSVNASFKYDFFDNFVNKTIQDVVGTSVPARLQSIHSLEQDKMRDITLEFLQELIAEEHPDVTLHSFVRVTGSKRGDNYTSMVYRLTLEGIRRHIEPDGSSENEVPWTGSIIYKCLPESVIRRETYKSAELFSNEFTFYNKVWPAMQRFQSKWAFKQRCIFKSIPKCYLAENDLVMLKDLKELDFVMVDRKQGLSIEQVYVVLKHLGQFHALSLAMKFNDKEKFFELLNPKDGLREVFFEQDKADYLKRYYDLTTQNAMAIVEEELDGHKDKEHYIKKFRSFCNVDTLYNVLLESVRPREPLAVICHGDCWPNNFMFKYASDGDIADMYFVDFQLARYSSPGTDLVYLLYLALDRCQRSEHLPSLLEYYTDVTHDALVTLSEENSVFHGRLNRKVFGEMIQQEFTFCQPFGLAVTLDMYPILTCDSDEAPNLYEAKENDPSELDITPFVASNEECRRRMTELVQECVDLGYI